MATPFDRAIEMGMVIPAHSHYVAMPDAFNATSTCAGDLAEFVRRWNAACAAADAAGRAAALAAEPDTYGQSRECAASVLTSAYDRAYVEAHRDAMIAARAAELTALRIGQAAPAAESRAPLAYERAWRLARAHYHWWAYGEAPPATWADCLHLEDLASARDEITGYGWQGVRASLSHTTGTGRLRWSVADDGAVHVEVHRPAGIVISAQVDPDGVLTIDTAGVEVHDRHWDALGYALCTLMSSTVPDWPQQARAAWDRARGPGLSASVACAAIDAASDRAARERPEWGL